MLDETDSGLDIDSLKAVAGGVAQLIGPDLGVLLITHYQRILNHHAGLRSRDARRSYRQVRWELAHELEEKATRASARSWVSDSPSGG